MSKKKTKKIAKKEAKKYFNANIGDASVANAATADAANQLANLTVQREEFNVADNTANGAVARCPEGQQVISGGGITGANDAYLTNSVPANA